MVSRQHLRLFLQLRMLGFFEGGEPTNDGDREGAVGPVPGAVAGCVGDHCCSDGKELVRV